MHSPESRQEATPTTVQKVSRKISEFQRCARCIKTGRCSCINFKEICRINIQIGKDIGRPNDNEAENRQGDS